MSSEILNSLLVMSNDGMLLSEYALKIPEGVLHQIYKTHEIHGVVYRRDLIGQSVNLDRKQLDSLRAFVDWHLYVLPDCQLRLVTYEGSDTPELLRQDMELILSIFNKDGGHVADIGLPSHVDLVALRKVVGLPHNHNLIGDFPLSHEWQLCFFSEYVSGLDCSKFDYELSSCARAE